MIPNFSELQFEVDEEYCDWCKAPLSTCHCDGGVGDNWVDLYLIGID